MIKNRAILIGALLLAKTLKDKTKTILFLLSAHQSRAGSRVVRIDPLCFLAGCRKRQQNQARSVSLSIGFFVLFIGAALCVFR